MNKEQAKKHGEVIRWWLDNTNKGVWYKTRLSGKWEITLTPPFTVDMTYIQNDEYAELRKKICDLENELSSLKGQIR